jgi:hypothetical protein
MSIDSPTNLIGEAEIKSWMEQFYCRVGTAKLGVQNGATGIEDCWPIGHCTYLIQPVVINRTSRAGDSAMICKIKILGVIHLVSLN